MNNRPRLWQVFVDEVRALLIDYVTPLILFARWLRRNRWRR